MSNIHLDISGVIICQNEEELITRTIDNIYPHVREVVILDGGSTDGTIDKIKSYPNRGGKIRLFNNKFNKHFGDQKNLACSKVKGVWILNIDCDEIIEQPLLESIPVLIKQNDYNVYGLPRKNFIDGVQTEVYPDYQYRLFRAYCRFLYPVHEELMYPHRQMRKLEGEGNHIIHLKSLARQKKQDDLYSDMLDTSNFENSTVGWSDE